MKKQRNCWLRGFVRSAVILALVLVPTFLIRGIPQPPMPFVGTMMVTLLLGTLFFGGIERYYRRNPDKK